jgi:hypothetical protein
VRRIYDKATIIRFGPSCVYTQCFGFCRKSSTDLLQLLYRHQTGDWGDLEDEDKESNEEALINDTRIFSSYSIAEDKIWIITEADRSLTTFLMPSDY